MSYVNFIRFDVNGHSIGWHDGDVGQNKLLTQAIVVIRLLGLKHPRLFGYCNKCARMRCLWMISHQNDILIPGLCCIYTQWFMNKIHANDQHYICGCTQKMGNALLYKQPKHVWIKIKTITPMYDNLKQFIKVCSIILPLWKLVSS